MPKFQPAARELPRNLPIVAIVGRPNVGKSTFFNRLVGERRAIVDDLPGVTRDRNYAEAVWAGRRFLLVDTGGLESETAGKLEENVQAQSHLAVAEADVIMFLLDGKGGLNPLDEDAVGWLRQTEKPVFFAVNKLDSRQRENNLYEFYALGLDKLYSISAEHGLGIPDLMDDVVQHLAPNIDSEEDDAAKAQPPLRVAIVGRPNVGKSTLTNRLLGFERSVVDSTPGTTRDAVDTPFNLRGEACVLIDTAGIRRKARIDDRIERFSVSRSLNAVDRGDLIVHIIDGPENVTDQDAQILSYAVQRGKAILLVVNKWDLVREAGGDARQIPRRNQVPLVVSRVCADLVYFGGDRFRRAQDARNRGAGGASVPAQGLDFFVEPSVANHRPGPYRAAFSQPSGKVLLRYADRRSAADVYFLRQQAGRHNGKLSKISGQSAAPAAGFDERADSAALSRPA